MWSTKWHLGCSKYHEYLLIRQEISCGEIGSIRIYLVVQTSTLGVKKLWRVKWKTSTDVIALMTLAVVRKKPSVCVSYASAELQTCMVGRTLYSIWFKIANNLSSEFHLTCLAQGHLAKSGFFIVLGRVGLIREPFIVHSHSNVRKLFQLFAGHLYKKVPQVFPNQSVQIQSDFIPRCKTLSFPKMFPVITGIPTTSPI